MSNKRCCFDRYCLKNITNEKDCDLCYKIYKTLSFEPQSLTNNSFTINLREIIEACTRFEQPMYPIDKIEFCCENNQKICNQINEYLAVTKQKIVIINIEYCEEPELSEKHYCDIFLITSKLNFISIEVGICRIARGLTDGKINDCIFHKNVHNSSQKNISITPEIGKITTNNLIFTQIRNYITSIPTFNEIFIDANIDYHISYPSLLSVIVNGDYNIYKNILDIGDYYDDVFNQSLLDVKNLKYIVKHIDYDNIIKMRRYLLPNQIDLYNQHLLPILQKLRKDEYVIIAFCMRYYCDIYVITNYGNLIIYSYDEDYQIFNIKDYIDTENNIKINAKLVKMWCKYPDMDFLEAYQKIFNKYKQYAQKRNEIKIIEKQIKELN